MHDVLAAIVVPAHVSVSANGTGTVMLATCSGPLPELPPANFGITSARPGSWFVETGDGFRRSNKTKVDENRRSWGGKLAADTPGQKGFNEDGLPDVPPIPAALCTGPYAGRLKKSRGLCDKRVVSPGHEINKCGVPF